MPLILAIEPDRRQGAKLTMIARNQLRAELVVADSVEQALATLDECVPDLLLTSPHIPSRDSAALSNRLRELERDGLRVQTMMVPALAIPGARLRALKTGRPEVRGRAGVDVRSRILPNVPTVACDLVVFGMQIAAQLERVAAERPLTARSAPPAAGYTTAATTPLDGAVSSSEDASNIISNESDDLVVELAEAGEDDAALSGIREAGTIETFGSLDETDIWTDILAAMRRDIEQAQSAAPSRVFEPTLELPDTVAIAPASNIDDSRAETEE